MSFRVKFLVILASIYVVQVISYHWMGIDYPSVLALFPADSPMFRWWQVFTFSLTAPPKLTILYVWEIWVIFSLAEPVVASLGRFSFLVLFFGASLFSILTWWLCSSLFEFMHVPALGFSASTFAILTVFCRTHKTATLKALLLPLTMRALHFFYFCVFASVVAFLARENPHFGLDIGGLVFAVLYTRGGERLFLGTARWLATAPLKMGLYRRRRRPDIRLVKTSSNPNSDSTD
jgi:membrane associated rhomboid family serine protease